MDSWRLVALFGVVFFAGLIERCIVPLARRRVTAPDRTLRTHTFAGYPYFGGTAWCVASRRLLQKPFARSRRVSSSCKPATIRDDSATSPGPAAPRARP